MGMLLKRVRDNGKKTLLERESIKSAAYPRPTSPFQITTTLNCGYPYQLSVICLIHFINFLLFLNHKIFLNKEQKHTQNGRFLVS
jgi:hypothetical protein